MTTRRTAMQALAAGTLGTLHVARSHAQQDTLTILVGAASTMDATARIVADHLKEALGRPTITVSKLGAGGRLALGDLKRAAPDGRTLMFSTSSLFAIYPHIFTKLDYDPVADFTPIAGLTWFDVALATGPATGPAGNPGIGAPDIKSLMAWMRARPGDVPYGAAPGTGSSSHFAGIAMALATGLKMTAVPYRDSAVGITDLAAGRLPLLITGTGALSELHKAGRLRVLATSGPTRSPITPDVPTFRESGIEMNIVNVTGLYGPARLPRETVARLQAALATLVEKPEFKARMAQMGMAIDFMGADRLAATLADERKRYEALVKASGYQPEPA